MDRRTAQEIAFDQAFGLWRGMVDDLARTRRVLREQEAKEAQLREQMIAARDKRVAEAAA